MQEEKLSCQREISWVVLDHDIPLDLVHILDQNPLSYVSPGKYTICLKRSITFLIKGVDNKRYVSAKFTVSDTCVVPVHLIIKVQQRMFTNMQKFPKDFNIFSTKNHWSIFSKKCDDLFQKIIFLYLRLKKSKFRYPKDQFFLIILNNKSYHHGI